MYHCILHILVCGDGGLLAAAARTVSPLERFEHHIEVSATPSDEEVAHADILLLDLGEERTVAIRQKMKPEAILIACALPEVIGSLSDEELDAADNWWRKPLDQRLCAARLRKILVGVKFRKDSWLTRNYLDTAIDSVPDMIWFKDYEGRHLKVNRSFCHTVGKDREDIAGKFHYYIWDIPEEEYKKGEYVCIETEDDVVAARETCLFMEKVKTHNGMRQFKTYKSPIFDENGDTIIGTVGVAHDVTDLENIGTELEILIRSIPFAVVIRDTQELICNMNDKFCEYFGVSRERMLGRSFDEWESAAIGQRVVNSEGYAETTVHVPTAEDDKILEVHEETIYDVFHSNVGKLCIYRNVTRERMLEKKVLHNMNTDFLTGLHNRRYFYEYIAEHRGKGPVSLLYVDLDRFKEINDTYGHGAGDEALIRTADILRSCFPEELIARLGGDEFVIAILGERELEALERLAQSLVSRVRQMFGASKRLHILSASVGVAQAEDEHIDIDLLLQQSDIALYEAKQRGKNQCRLYRK